MTLTDEEMKWIDNIDPAHINKYDRGRLRSMTGQVSQSDPALFQRIAALLKGDPPPPPDQDTNQGQLDLYQRGVDRARTVATTDYPIQKGNI